MEELTAEAGMAKAALDDARDKLAAAARGVLSEEANSYAAKAASLELAALSSCSQLETELRDRASGWGGSSAAKLMIESERGAASARRAADGASADKSKASDALDSARSIATKIVALECEALSNRVQVEGAVRSRVLGWGSGIALNPLAKRVVHENLSTAIAVRNSPEWAGANKAADHWRARHAELMKHSDAAPVQGATHHEGIAVGNAPAP